MSAYRTLFLICDSLGHPSPAFETAGALAQSSGASVHLCAFDHSEAIALVGLVDRPGMEKARGEFLLKRRASAQSLANTFKSRGIHATADVAWARPVHEEMLQQIAELKPDVVIKDARYEPVQLKRMLFTPTDWHLMRRCPVPLMLVRGADSALPRRIVVAVDAGPYAPDTQDLNRRILGAAQELALCSGAELHLVFTLSPMTDIAAAIGTAPASFSAEAHNALLTMRTQAFEAIAHEHAIPPDRRHLLAGRVGPAVAEFATRHRADMIVIGASHRTGLDRWVMGSSAEQIADDAPCSVLIVPPGEPAPLPKL